MSRQEANDLKRDEKRRRQRMYDQAREVACQAVGLTYAKRAVSNVHGTASTSATGELVTDAKSLEKAKSHVIIAGSLEHDWDIEISNALGRQIVGSGVSIFPGQRQANGRPLAPLHS